jgi:hypothetical protein
MKYKNFDICKPIKYDTNNGDQKTFWANVGKYTEFTKEDGSVNRVIEIYAIGLKAQIFEQKPKNDSKGGQYSKTTPNINSDGKDAPKGEYGDYEGISSDDSGEETISAEEIPF